MGESLLLPVPPRAWTLDDLTPLPADGSRYELIDGSLLVSPPPSPLHQVVATALQLLLHEAAPGHLLVLAGGAGIHVALPAEQTQFLVPDVLVVRRDAVAGALQAFAPADVVLVVEVISPSTVTRDQVAKRSLCACLGLAGYWLVDPNPPASVSALSLHADHYEERASAAGDEELMVEQPFPVRLRPAALPSAF